MQVRVDLAQEDVERIARAVVAALPSSPSSSPWMDTKTAAAYAGCTVNSLQKAMAAREVRFTQDAKGGKAWFRPEWIDQWRGL